jgi:hypothetical protein
MQDDENINLILKNTSEVILKSQAFPSGLSEINPLYYSPIHQLLKDKMLESKELKDVTQTLCYKPLTTNHLEEIYILHREWFPVKYSKNYFLKFLEGTECICIGCFITIDGKENLIGN